MSERPDDLRDDLLATRLRAELGSPPPRLAFRLEHLSSAGLHDRHPRAAPLWREVAPQLAGAALLLVMLAVALVRLFALLSSTAPPAPVLPAWSAAWTALMVPIAVLLWVEALRGAPTVRRWLR